MTLRFNEESRRVFRRLDEAIKKMMALKIRINRRDTDKETYIYSEWKPKKLRWLE